MYGTANVSEVKNNCSQDHILKNTFGLRKTESVWKVKDLKILNAQELHLYELFKEFYRVLRQDSPRCFLNDAINKFEFEKGFKWRG